MDYKAILLDADGVTILAPQLYPYTYVEERGIAKETIQPFIAGPFQDALRGKADLKQLIAAASDVWQLKGSVQQLLDDWFEAENVPSVALLPIIKAARGDGLHVYLVTNQEKYRAEYLRRVMFPDVFDDMLISCELGALKSEPEYWAATLAKIAADLPHITPQQILYLDDSQTYVDIAKQTGIDARLYTGPGQLLGLLRGAESV